MANHDSHWGICNDIITCRIVTMTDHSVSSLRPPWHEGNAFLNLLIHLQLDVLHFSSLRNCAELLFLQQYLLQF